MSHSNTGAKRAGRNRALSINSLSATQQLARDSSLDTLQNDLTLIRSQWSKVLTDASNPLELALAFLDDTSVGLGHRYHDFTQLRERIGLHLKEVVNEHSQAFNANVASYSKTVSSLTAAQDKITGIKKNMTDINTKVTMDKGSLKDLNDDSLRLTNMIESLSCIEELLQIPERIDECFRREDFRGVQKLLERGFVLTNTPTLRGLRALQPVCQQLSLQEHTLFQNLIEELHSIVYSKTGSIDLENNILNSINTSKKGFSTLENYLYNIVNIDLMKQSDDLSSSLEKFIDNVRNPSFHHQNMLSSNLHSESEYARILGLLVLIRDINKLPAAISILVDRAKEEFHSIILRSTENVRTKYLTLIKMTNSYPSEMTFGLSVRDQLSSIMQECFWEIFMKLLVAIQRHRAIYESIVSLQPATQSSRNAYPFDKVWVALFQEIETFILRYLNNPALQRMKGNKQRIKLHPREKKEEILFEFENNVEGDNSRIQEHVGELQSLLKDIFLGFNASSNYTLDSIYIEDTTFEQEESLIPPSVFNIKILLEPFLLFSQTASNLIPPGMLDKATPSMLYFTNFMENKFHKMVELTFNYMYMDKVESNNPYAVENISENRNVFKTAVEFQSLFNNMLYILNIANVYRPQMIELPLGLLKRFYDYYARVFQLLLGPTSGTINKKIMTMWSENENLTKYERAILEGDESVLDKESAEMFKPCRQFYKRGKGLSEDDMFNALTLETVIYFANTLYWILDWLQPMKKVIDTSSGEHDVSRMDANALRDRWSFFEYSDFEREEQRPNLRILLDNTNSAKFDMILDGFSSLKFQLLSLLRFDVRSRCIYFIGRLFQTTDVWNLEVSSIELNQNIAQLISELRTTESKLKQQLPAGEKDKIFMGMDTVNNHAFISGATSIDVINENGVKKMLRNINVLQHTSRNLYHEPSKVSMSNAVAFYTLVGSTEINFFQKIESGDVSFLTPTELKIALRLSFSEDLQRQANRHSAASSTNGVVKPMNRRYNSAFKKLEALIGGA